jgi:hypothetical protein
MRPPPADGSPYWDPRDADDDDAGSATPERHHTSQTEPLGGDVLEAAIAARDGTATPKQVALLKQPAVQAFQKQLKARVAPLIDAAQKQVAPDVRNANARVYGALRQAVQPAIRDANQQARPLVRRVYRYAHAHPELFATKDRTMVRRLHRAVAIRSPVKRHHEIERIRCDYFSSRRGRACRPAQNTRSRGSSRGRTRTAPARGDPDDGDPEPPGSHSLAPNPRPAFTGSTSGTLFAAFERACWALGLTSAEANALFGLLPAASQRACWDDLAADVDADGWGAA